MFPLFELAKLLNFSPEIQKTENSVSVRQIAWREVGDRSFLALLISNGYLVLRYATHGSVPVVRQLPWHPDRPIQSMTFDPTATWLLCITQKDVLYIVPALALLDPRAQIEHLWKLDDITRIRHRKRRGQPTCLAWWRSFNGDQVAVIGTKLGFVLFVDLQTERLLSETDVSEQVSNIDILYHESQASAHALITTKSNSQWKILLETKDQLDGSEDNDGFTAVSLSILQSPESRASEFLVKRIQQFSSSTFLSPATIDGKPRVAARDLHTKRLKIYSTALDRSPLCAYVVPESVDEVVVTDRLLFFSSTKESSSLELVAARLDHAKPVTDQEDFNNDSVVQTFQLEGSEHILALFKRSFPFYWHEKREEERKKSALSKLGTTVSVGSQDPSPAFHVSSHTVLDGCVVVTTHNVYECRPRVSPEVLFVEMAVSRSDQAGAEAVAAALDLEVSGLYYLAAQHQLSRHDYARASRFFQLAKSPHLQRVGAFAQYGRMSEVVLYLRQTLDCKRHELKSDEVGHLSDMMVLAYVQQLLEDKSRTNELTYDLREFLKTNTHYSPREAIDALVDNGFYEIALDMGKVRQCLFEVLERLVNIGGSCGPLLEDGLHRLPFGKLGQIRQGSLLQYLRPADLVRMLDDQPSFVLDFVAHFQTILGDLDVDTLRKVIQLFDISLPSYRKLITISGQSENTRSHDLHNPLSSMSSSAGGRSEMDDSQEPLEGQLKLVDFFVRCVILLNGRQHQDIPLTFTQEAFTPLYTKEECRKDDVQCRLPVRQKLLSAGQQHSALVQDERLYLWGDCSTQDRPQREADKTLSDMWRPFTPAAFQPLRVTSVSCGAHHCMVITDDGVYGWGDCRYGQLGVGHVYPVPVRIPQRVERLSDMHCVEIVCGHYHTVSLMEDCSVRAWGWGTHGQLCQGSAEDSHLPKVVSVPGGAKVCNVAAGYAHTLVLTEPEGLVYASGCGVFGQLGLGTTCKHSTLRHIDTLPNGVISIATKDFHCVAVTSEGGLYQWGASPNSLCDMVRDQRQARLRLSAPPANLVPHQHYLKPTPVNTYNVVAKIIQVECGSNFSALVTEDGEVFTWGRNYDGQLGIGNRTDQKTPVMVNRINDRKMAAVTCGADHMVVMDTERQVWSWGRNDLGQLAVVTSQGSGTPGGQGIYVSMGIFAAVWPTKVPSINKITCAVPQRPLPLVTSTVGTGQWHVSLPQLFPYTCDTLFTLLQYVPDTCDPARWLQQCLDLRLWGTAGSLALRQGTLPLALHCHLSALKGGVESETNRKTQLVLIAEYYLKQLGQCSAANHKAHVQTVQDILCQLGEVWVTERLDVALFTDILNKHLQLVAWPFFLLMTRSDSQTDVESAHNTSSSASLSLQPELLASLGVTFCLQVTQTVITLLRDDKIPGMDTSSICTLSPEALALLPRHRMISPDKLWEEILHNVHKEATEAQSSITLSAHQLETLTAAIDIPTRDGAGGGDGPTQTAVLFTCGHHMPRRTLLVEAVPQLEVHLAEMDMPQSAALLSSQYAHKGAMSVACPKCVLNTIRTT